MDFLTNIIDVVRTYIGTLYYAPTEWYFGLSSLVLATASYLYFKRGSSGSRYSRPMKGHQSGSAREFVRFLFPRSVYRHRSTTTDLLYLISFPLIAGALFKPALAFSVAGVAYTATQSVLGQLWGDVSYSDTSSASAGPLLIAVFTLVSALAADFGFFLHHFLLHKFDFLWQFHKVHHSAQVLTPLTDYRAHPLEILTYGHAQGAGLGGVQGLFNYFLGNQIEVSTVLGINAVFFVYYLMAYPLRHSHIWISYGPFASRFLISPAQHQIHHSTALAHRDKNLGGFFAIWDWMFGTLYVPKTKEELQFGLGDDDGEDYRSFWWLYLRPFQTAARSVAGKVGVGILVILFSVFAFRAFSERGLSIF